jgi:hypothetical protein
MMVPALVLGAWWLGPYALATVQELPEGVEDEVVMAPEEQAAPLEEAPAMSSVDPSVGTSVCVSCDEATAPVEEEPAAEASE